MSGCPFHHSASADSTPEQGGSLAPSRRSMFSAGGVAAGLAGLMALSGCTRSEETASGDVKDIYPLRGEHQSGILTPAQDAMYTAAFDLTTSNVEDVKKLLSEWTVAAEQMMNGDLIGGEPKANKQAPPRDTGEAWGYAPSGLTITFGLGAGVFVTPEGEDRYGLANKMPAVLRQGSPTFSGEQLRSDWSGGDLLVQACANDSQVVLHAIRNLKRIAIGTADLRWTQLGFGRTSSTSTDQETPRNLFGFKDGTNNIKAEDPADELNEHLWVQSGDDADAEWMAGGTYYAARKIRMFLEMWDRTRLMEQEDIFGRDKRFGVPLSHEATSAKEEFTAVDFEATDENGDPLIPVDCHIRMVAPETNDGRRMLRRGYNYAEGSDSLGRLQAGLFFVAFVRNPHSNFYPILDKMTKGDALEEYLEHQSNALFAIPAGVREGDTMVAQALFE